jgi:negative regulator of flagellin synthesis FlgM
MDVKKIAPAFGACPQTNRPARGRGAKAASNDAQRVSEASQSPESRREPTESEGVRGDLVEQLKRKIRQGTYRPDIRRAAFNLVHDERTPLVE